MTDYQKLFDLAVKIIFEMLEKIDRIESENEYLKTILGDKWEMED